MLQKYFWLFLAVLAGFIALYNFQTSPGFWFDEGIMAQAAKNVAFQGVYGIQTAPGEFYINNFWITTGYPVVFPTALFLKIFGVSVWAARVTPFIYLLLFVIISYFFIKKLYGFAPAALSGLLLVTFPPFYGNGKALLGEVPGLFWFVLGGFLYLLYEEKKQSRFLYISALALGLSVAVKPYYALIVPGVIFLILYLWFKRSDFDWREAVLFGSFFSVPIFVWAFFAFDLTSLRYFGSNISYFLNSYAVQSFEPLKNLFRFVSESTPIHFSVLALVVFASFFLSLRRKNDFHPILGVFIVFVVLAFLWYLKTPGWYRYFFPAHIMLILLFPSALAAFANRFIGIAIILAVILFQAGFLFLNYDKLHGDDVLRLSDYMQKNIEGSASIFVRSLPEAGFMLDSAKLYQHIFISDNLEIGSETQDLTADYLIAGRGEGVSSEYVLSEGIGHYRIYKKIE